MRCKFECGNVFFEYPLEMTKGESFFSIGEKTYIGKHSVLTAWDSYEGYNYSPKVIIGSNCHFGEYLNITCIKSINIGNGCLTGKWVTITDNAHGEIEEMLQETRPNKRMLISKGAVNIGDNVWIGDKVTIVSGVTIGRGCIIGANAVVTKNMPPYSLVGGIPARVIKTLKKDEY